MCTRRNGLSGRVKMRRVRDRPYTSCHIESHWFRGTFSVEKRKHVKSPAAEAITPLCLLISARTRHAQTERQRCSFVPKPLFVCSQALVVSAQAWACSLHLWSRPRRACCESTADLAPGRPSLSVAIPGAVAANGSPHARHAEEVES